MTMTDAVRCLAVYAVTLLIHFLCTGPRRALACTDRDAKKVLHMCDPKLAGISWTILATTDRNYSAACTWFAEYVLCVEPGIHDCSSKLLKPYWRRRKAYTDAPYLCQIPEIPQYLVDQYKWRNQRKEELQAKTFWDMNKFDSGSHRVASAFLTVLACCVALLFFRN